MEHTVQNKKWTSDTSNTYFTYPLHPNVGHKATMSLLHR